MKSTRKNNITIAQWVPSSPGKRTSRNCAPKQRRQQNMCRPRTPSENETGYPLVQVPLKPASNDNDNDNDNNNNNNINNNNNNVHPHNDNTNDNNDINNNANNDSNNTNNDDNNNNQFAGRRVGCFWVASGAR